MNLRHIRLIMKREYMERLRSPGFIIGTVLGMLLFAGLSFLPQLLKVLDQQSSQKIAVVDPRNLVFPYIPKDTGTLPISTQAESSDQPQTPLDVKINFVRADSASEQTLSEEIRQGKINAYITVQGDRASSVSLTYHAKDRPSALVSARVLSLLNSALTESRIREAGLTSAQVEALFAPPDFKVAPVVGGSLTDERVLLQSQALVYFLLVLLYGSMVVYGVQVATGVVFEKSSRVMEVLITSVRPIELMLGKIVGIGLVGLTQTGLWVVVGFAAFFISGVARGGSQLPVDVTSVPPATLIYFLVFFLLGYLAYAALYAALGSLVNKTEDVNSITMPVTLLLVANYFLSIASLGNPDAEYVKWLAFLPVLTPMLMFIRVALGSVGWWEPLLAVALLIATILFFAWLGAKIYRVGVLLYGKRPSFREIGRLLRTA